MFQKARVLGEGDANAIQTAGTNVALSPRVALPLELVERLGGSSRAGITVRLCNSLLPQSGNHAILGTEIRTYLWS